MSLSNADLGSADLVEERTIETDEWGSLSKVGRIPRQSLSSSAEARRVVDEAERSVHDALMVTKDVIEYPYVVAGGGAPEAFATKHVGGWAKTMIEVLKYVNLAFKSHGLPSITGKVALDYGRVLVVRYGRKLERSHVDIVGRTISIVAKMLPYAKLTRVIAGQALYAIPLSNNQSKKLFINSNADKLGWSYIDETNGYPYKLYSLTVE